MKGPNINQLERSATPYSIIVTDASGVQRYISPGPNGTALIVTGGIPGFHPIPMPSEFEQYAFFASFPPVGDTDVIYYAADTNQFYIWNGSAYVAVPTPASFSFTGAGNSGPSQVISNGDTANWLASNGFSVVASPVRTFTLTPPVGTAANQFMRWNHGMSVWEASLISAALISNAPSGNISATDVQSAVNELDSEKQVNIQYQDEGVNLGTAGTVDTVNYVGAGVTATRAGNTVTVTIPGGGGGEANTASNVNVGGVGVFKQKTGVDLEFRGVNSGNAGVSVTLDAGNNEIDVSAVASSTAGNVVSIDANGIFASQVTEYFTPADGSTTLTLSNTPKAGTQVLVYRNGIIEIPVTDWTISGTTITVTTPYNPSSGGAANSQRAHVTYWI